MDQEENKKYRLCWIGMLSVFFLTACSTSMGWSVTVENNTDQAIEGISIIQTSTESVDYEVGEIPAGEETTIYLEDTGTGEYAISLEYHNKDTVIEGYVEDGMSGNTRVTISESSDDGVLIFD